ncbi:MAG: VanZ family protein [Flavobacteriaceae bacterium]|nr:VanZ family protein [Flavobacteriaceae bacterium]
MDNHNLTIKIISGFYFIILTWLLLRPSAGKGFEFLGITYNDKINHTVAFLGLSLLGSISSFPAKNPFICVIFFTLYGVLTEFLQGYMSIGRTFEFLDILADFTGCVIGVILAEFIMKKLNRSSDN